MIDQEIERKAPWGIGEALAIFIIFAIIAYLGPEIGYLTEYVLGLFSIELSVFGIFIFFSIIQFLIFILYIYRIVVKKYKLSFNYFCAQKYSIWELIKYGLLSSILLFFITMMSAAFISWLFPSQIDPQAIMEYLNFATTKKEMILVFIVTVFFAPVSEELYFRGFLYKAFRKKLPVHISIAIVSTIFGAVHFDLFRFVPFFVAGVILNHIYEKYQNIIISIIAHASWNALMTLALFSTVGS